MIDLYDWQRPSCAKLTAVLKAGDVALDLSATGTGKTYVALAVARELGLTPSVIAPKSALTTWRRVSEAMGVTVQEVSNVEQVKLGKTGMVTPVGKKVFRWNLPKGSLVIVDEAHRFGGQKTQNAVMLAQTKQYGVKVLALSATLSDQGPLGLRAIGYLCGLHRFSSSDYYQWCLRNGCYRDPFYNGVEFKVGPERLVHLEKIRQQLLPFGVRVTIDSVPGFPENFVVPELVDVPDDKRDEVNRLYAQLPTDVTAPKNALGVTLNLRARQTSEVAKIPLLVDRIEDALEEGRSVVVFLSFLASIKMLREALFVKGFSSGEVSGNIPADKRAEAVDKFQTDGLRVIVNQIDSGGLSISLHHLATSKYPRTAFICPNYSATSFVQALGRCHRAGGLSKTVQKIVLMAGTVEEKVYANIQRKLTNITALSDMDLMGVDNPSGT